MPLIANSHEVFVLPSGEQILIPKAILTFQAWGGPPIEDTYGGKALLDYKGTPLFAELVILRTLEEDGWSGVWVDNYRRKFRIGMPGIKAPITLHPKQQRTLDTIKEVNGSLSGCWDVLAWRENEILFAESKLSGKDRIRSTQIKWLQSTLKVGFTAKNFLLVEWSR